MTSDALWPSAELLTQEYVLVQAWKKTSTYIRYHNWFSDTLELDRSTVNLPAFLERLASELARPDEWASEPLRLVPAPKSQRWRVKDGAPPPTWEPADRGTQLERKLRPLAHVSLRDQVAATAVMLCLADRVETSQGDPRRSVEDAATRASVISYGNRLLCDEVAGGLRHRWGSGKLYRAYYQDYRTFLARPSAVAAALTTTCGQRTVIVHLDLRQFYDRVRPSLLAEKLGALQRDGDDPRFFQLAGRLLNWAWHPGDRAQVDRYALRSGLADFSTVALPQGLVAAGFFANVALLDLDAALRRALGTDIAPGIHLVDASRYVDDLRLVVVIGRDGALASVEGPATDWLEGLLRETTPGLLANAEKTSASEFGGDERPLLAQSRRMARIQTAISGGFDAIGGEDIIDAVQGLLRAQERFSESRLSKTGWELSPVPDVRDATVGRFAAARFRSTFRSLRPLLADGDSAAAHRSLADDSDAAARRQPRSQADLDDEARSFALGLIESWVNDPSNVRLLRIGLDIWPHPDVLERVLSLLRPLIDKGGRRNAPRRVAWYCLSEILRAGATETGLVPDEEMLPASTDLAGYRECLRAEAVRLARLPAGHLPWYLRQQVLLYLAAISPATAPVVRTGAVPETQHYRELIRFLRGDVDGVRSTEFATLAVLSRRCFLGHGQAARLALDQISARRLEDIFERDPNFATEIVSARPGLAPALSPRVRHDLSLELGPPRDASITLSRLVREEDSESALRSEPVLLEFALGFLRALRASSTRAAIAPSEVDVTPRVIDGVFDGVDHVDLRGSRLDSAGSLYLAPPWSEPEDRWRFQLGFLLRFILTGQSDFTIGARRPVAADAAATYRPASSHWFQRRYAFYNGQPAFGDDSLPISDWFEGFLSALLHWPGARLTEPHARIVTDQATTEHAIAARLELLVCGVGSASKVRFLPMMAPRPTGSRAARPLRACIAQTVIPSPTDFDPADLTLSAPMTRKRHRRHIAAALAAIERMLDLRETHKGQDGRLDWLILPELAVHPSDVTTHLVRFARLHKTIILAGLTYQALDPTKPPVNSALWVIPRWSPSDGLQIVTRRQGKAFLAPSERDWERSGLVRAYRPCQWLIGYDWSPTLGDEPLWLTASVCYDATDLALAADLRDRSDVFAIPALNKDVTTFDTMAEALHYHMFQMVIVANNGTFGGSSPGVNYIASVTTTTLPHRIRGLEGDGVPLVRRSSRSEDRRFGVPGPPWGAKDGTHRACR